MAGLLLQPLGPLNELERTQAKRTRTHRCFPAGMLLQLLLHGRLLQRAATCSLLTDGHSRRQCERGHFGQHLRQVRERHGDMGQVLGHGAVHDAE